MRTQSRLQAAAAACDANPNCVVAQSVSPDWCAARQGDFIPGRWFAIGDATIRDRCFYDPANIPTGTNTLPPGATDLDPTDQADLNTLNSLCRESNGPDWIYENGGCIQSPVITEPLPGSVVNAGLDINDPNDYGLINGECQAAYGPNFSFNSSLKLCASRN
jgi:hypothetical protein